MARKRDRTLVDAILPPRFDLPSKDHHRGPG